MISIEHTRQFFADELRVAAGLRNPAVWRAFMRVPRERFYGSGPWRLAVTTGLAPAYIGTADDDPRWLYHNVSVALDEAHHIISAQPSLIARCFEELDVRPADRVLHVGSGAGYYTAVLAEMTGENGRVLATEVNADLAAQARENLAPFPWVTVHEGAGLPDCRQPFDAIFVNAGVTHVETAWLDSLCDGGRLLAPITAAVGATHGAGFILRIVREGSEFGVAAVSRGMIYSAIGLRDPALESIVAQAITTGAILRAGVLRRDRHALSDSCVVHREDACLSLLADGEVRSTAQGRSPAAGRKP